LQEIQQLKAIWNLNTDKSWKFIQHRSSILPNLSTKLCARVVVYSRLLEWQFALVNILWATTLTIFAIAFLWMIFPVVSWPTFLLAINDWCISVYSIWNTVRLALFGVETF